MRKSLNMILAVALVGPASLAWGEEPAAAAKKAGEAAEVAGQKAEQAGEKATKAGEKAEKAARHAADGKQHAAAGHDDPGVKASRGAIDELKRADPGLSRFFDGAAGYAVFPTVGKGAVGVGGAHGDGVLYEKGVAVGETKLTQVTVGLQVGAQAYTEVIFFETAKALEDFKKGEFAMAAQVSAVAAKAGASANVRICRGRERLHPRQGRPDGRGQRGRPEVQLPPVPQVGDQRSRRPRTFTNVLGRAGSPLRIGVGPAHRPFPLAVWRHVACSRSEDEKTTRHHHGDRGDRRHPAGNRSPSRARRAPTPSLHSSRRGVTSASRRRRSGPFASTSPRPRRCPAPPTSRR